jgi:hypothetical protein
MAFASHPEEVFRIETYARSVNRLRAPGDVSTTSLQPNALDRTRADPETLRTSMSTVAK